MDGINLMVGLAYILLVTCYYLNDFYNQGKLGERKI